MNQQEEISNISFSFKKEERLCSKKVIDRLFLEGERFLAHPLKVVFLRTQLPVSIPVQAGFSVSKKNFKRAVHRNRIKRLMREAYRLNKHALYTELDAQQLAVFFIYIGKEMTDFKTVERAIKKAIQRLNSNLKQESAVK